jgi:hypothetical protein
MICPRCGREQPTLASPCPDCGLLDSGAFNPGTTRPPEVVCAIDPHAGAETPESSKPVCRSEGMPAAGDDPRFLSRESDRGSFATDPPHRPKRPQPYFCNDCGRRFYNIGWHCEACGSSNYEPEPPSGSEPQATLDSQSSVSAAVRGEQPSDPELRVAFMRAHQAWAKRFQPWLLMDEEWLNA